MYLLKNEFLVRINTAVDNTTAMYVIIDLCYIDIDLAPNKPSIVFSAIKKMTYIAKKGLIYRTIKRTTLKGCDLDLLTNSSYLG